MKRVDLHPIDPSGDLALPASLLPATLRQNCALTADFYKVVGFAPPWIGYVSVIDGHAVGGGAFKGRPQDNRVEIAYFTLPELESRGHATATARELVRIARSTAPDIVVAAQTLPFENASTSVLRKLGFSMHGRVVHPEDGEVWEWRLSDRAG